LILNTYLTGLAILVVAILVNGIAQALGVTTWYRFIEILMVQGIWEAITSQGIGSLVFLFMLYPLILGLTGFWIARIIH
jgi:hypothetical protein